MGFLADKKILITGLLSNRSIAYGIARACRREGATLAFTYVNDDLKERVVRLAGEFGSGAVPVVRVDRPDIANSTQVPVVGAGGHGCEPFLLRDRRGVDAPTKVIDRFQRAFRYYQDFPHSSTRVRK